MTLDPKVSTNSTTANTQFSSSWGDCSMLGYHEPRERRDSFIVGNWPNLQKEIAVGSGPHLNAFIHLSGCDAAATSAFIEDLRANYDSYDDALQFADYVNGSRVDAAASGCAI